MSQNVVKCANSSCNALVLASRKFCSKHKPASKPAEIVGRIDPKQFARTMADTRRERDNRRNAETAAKFMTRAPFAAAFDELREEFREKAPIVATGRSHGRFVSRATYAEAEATAMKLAMLGFGE